MHLFKQKYSKTVTLLKVFSILIYFKM